MLAIIFAAVIPDEGGTPMQYDRLIAFKLPTPLLRALRRRARNEAVSLSEVVRRACSAAIEHPSTEHPSRGRTESDKAA